MENKETLKSSVISEVGNYMLKHKNLPDVFECKVVWKGSKDGETALIRIYNGGNSDLLPDDDEYLFYPSDYQEFYDLLANITLERLQDLPNYDEVSDWLTEEEWGDSKEDFVIVDVLDFWNTDNNPLGKTFTSSNGIVTITRGDYYSFPCPLQSMSFDNEKMQELADTIGIHLERDYRYTREMVKDTENEQVQDVLYKLIEECAIELGMRYCEDYDTIDDIRTLLTKNDDKLKNGYLRFNNAVKLNTSKIPQFNYANGLQLLFGNAFVLVWVSNGEAVDNIQLEDFDGDFLEDLLEEAENTIEKLVLS